MCLSKRISTSKILIWAVVVAGLAALCAGIDPTPTQLSAYGVILSGAVYNRFDSRRQAYKLSAKIGGNELSLETRGHGDDAKN